MAAASPVCAQIDSNPTPATALPADPLAVAGPRPKVGDDAPPIDTPPPAPPRKLGAELWRGARIGMGVADVASLFPTAGNPTGGLSLAPVVDAATGEPIAVATPTLSSFLGGQTATAAASGQGAGGEMRADGSRSGLAMRVNFDGGPAVAQFYFKADRLTAVIIDRRDLKSGRTAENLAVTQALMDQLAAENGEPRRCVRLDGVSALTCSWPKTAIKVVASYRDMGGKLPTLSVTYSPLVEKKIWEPAPVKKLRAR